MAHGMFIVLDGGRGRKLSPLTDNTPKALLRFGPSGRIIDFPIYNCLTAELDAIVLSPYFAKPLDLYLRLNWRSAFAGIGRSLTVIAPRAGTSGAPGEAGSILYALSRMDRIPDFIAVIPGDHVYRMDYRPLIDFHLEHGGPATAAVVPAERDLDFALALADDDRLQAPTASSRKLVRPAGGFIFTGSELKRRLEAGLRSGATDLLAAAVMPWLAEGRLRGWRFTAADGKPGWLREVNDLDSYWRAHLELIEGRGRELSHYQGPGLRRSPATRFNLVLKYGSGKKQITNSMIADTAVIGAATIENSVIAPGAHVEDLATVRRSVVLDGAVIRKGASVIEALVEPGAEIRPPLAPVADAPAGRPHRAGLHLMGPADLPSLIIPAPPPVKGLIKH
jgi:glucose-1-phosphate adenylyltransferase